MLLISAVIAYAPACIIVTGQRGTAEFKTELGRMVVLIVPVVTLPTMVMMSAIVWHIVRSVTSIAGVPTRDVARNTRVCNRIGC